MHFTGKRSSGRACEGTLKIKQCKRKVDTLVLKRKQTASRLLIEMRNFTIPYRHMRHKIRYCLKWVLRYCPFCSLTARD